ncbi:MAG: IclR family transcriptional regulator [Rhizobiaceae bacterium]
MSSLDKVFTILEVMAARDEPYGLTELARATSFDKATTYRLLEALIRHGYVTKLESAPQYELSLKLWMLGSRVVARRSLMQHAQNALRELADLSGETVYLAISDKTEAVYVAKVDSRYPLRAHTPIGGRVPLYCGSTGKALLAYLDEDQVDAVAKTLRPFTPRTIVTRKGLLEELARIRARGFALAEGEWDLSISGVAAAVFGADGNLAASIGVTGPIERLGHARLTELGPRVAQVAWRLSKTLGCPADSPTELAYG